jgi:hypothetical protein
MLFKDIIEGRYRVFNRMKEDERIRNIGIMKYIDKLSSMAGVDIQLWDAMKIFGKDEIGNKLIDDKNEINRRFFTELDRLANETPAAAPEELFNAQLQQQLKLAESRHIASRIAKEQEHFDRSLQRAIDAYNNHTAYLKEASEYGRSMQRMTGHGLSLEEQIKQVHASQFWTFIGVTNGTRIEFATRANVVLTHKNQAAGIDMNVNFGKFKASFNILDSSLRVYGIGGNIDVNGYPHPHIQEPRTGGICWGTASNAATKALAACTFVEPMTLLATVLSHYNPDSPYISMERFVAKVGTPEDMMLVDSLNYLRDAAAARFAAIDTRDADLDTPTNPLPASIITTHAPAEVDLEF